ncbi:NUDIX domain-containing protein [Paenibacillus oceani]|uniref:NUDIX domain-containing protein n=1 Tax=Paenibacillus oceani TaxID=2772510 RepID=A0A927C3X4_9BACL|nr:NUDIX domain-containing protein [Paenibacillus oceani]MBD2860835.1 NUDIX domain-containing protein [Paenibacillus oceani]
MNKLERTVGQEGDQRADQPDNKQDNKPDNQPEDTPDNKLAGIPEREPKDAQKDAQKDVPKYEPKNEPEEEQTKGELEDTPEGNPENDTGHQPDSDLAQVPAILELMPEGAEIGTGLALRDRSGRLLFFVAGSRHRMEEGERFFAGIGGHLEPGESLTECAEREAREEIGAEVELRHAERTLRVSSAGVVSEIAVSDYPAPYVWYEMIHPPGSPREGRRYQIVIYRAVLAGPLSELKEDEVCGVIAMTDQQVAEASGRKPTLRELIGEGAGLVAALPGLEPETRLFPIGTAAALSFVFQAVRSDERLLP